MAKRAKGGNGRSGANIAVVGMACRYPGVDSLLGLWESVLAQRREFREFPKVRLSKEYWDANPEAPDKTYCSRAAFIEGFVFDWAKRRIPRTTFESTDIVHWLALDVADQALRDAGYKPTKEIRERTGVIVGNTLTGEQTRSNLLRLRWPFVRRVFAEMAREWGLTDQQVDAVSRDFEARYKSPFFPITEDSLAGGLANTIAGRVCNYFDLHGGGYTVDGACSSSLLAICTAAEQLSTGALDVALAGGVDISLDPFEIVGFAKTGALARTEMRVYDERANGFMPGEGCGFVVLKRLEDAERDGDFVYAVVKGWGISSDGKGGITAPTAHGQALAIRRAYERAGYGLPTISFVEGHGTGTPVGDKTEIRGLAAALPEGHGVADHSIAMTSLKSVMGHTKAAAGIGGFIKTAMAINRRVIPPTAGCEIPNPVFREEGKAFYPAISGRVVDDAQTMRAGVSAMGFGGINTHITLESGPAKADKLKPALDETALLATWQASELFVVSAETRDELEAKLRELESEAALASPADLTDLAQELATRARPSHEARFAAIAGEPVALAGLFAEARRTLAGGAAADQRMASVQRPGQTYWLRLAGKRPVRVGYLLPGQGSQQLGMGASLVQRHDWARALLDDADRWTRDYLDEPLSQIIYRPTVRLPPESVEAGWKRALAIAAQPAVCFTSILYASFLQRLGLTPNVVGGHSLGELTACHLAGAFDAEALLRTAALRGKAMNAVAGTRGTMASLACDEARASKLCAAARDDHDAYVVVANVNSPKQTVISGDESAVQRVVKQAAQEGIVATMLPVANAFHSKYVDAAVRVLKEEAPVPGALAATQVQLFSSLRGQRLEAGTNLRQHFAQQAREPVQFSRLVQSMAEQCDLFVECGPGQVLSNLCGEILSQGDGAPAALPVSRRGAGMDDLNVMLGRLFAEGVDLRWSELYRDRLFRIYRPIRKRLFVGNTVEGAITADKSIGPHQLPGNGRLAALTGLEAKVLDKYLDERGAFLGAIIAADLGVGRPAASNGEARTQAIATERASNGHAGGANGTPAHAGNGAAAGGAAPAAAAPDSAVLVPEVVSTGGDAAAIADRLIELISRRTGYQKETISVDARLLDDLNLDSIKASDLIVTVARESGVAGRLEVAKLATSSIATVAAAIQQAKIATAAGAAGDGTAPAAGALGPSSGLPGAAQTEGQDWVRMFTSRWITQPAEGDASALSAGSHALLITEAEQLGLAEAIGAAFTAAGGTTNVARAEDLAASQPAERQAASHIFVLLGGVAPADSAPATRIQAAVRRLRAAAVEQTTGESPRIVFVVRGGTDFGNNGAPIPAEPESWACLGFAQSLHLERPSAMVRALDVSPALGDGDAAAIVLGATEAPGAFIAASYDDSRVRRVPEMELHQPAFDPERPIAWGPTDVIVVTGGAKGITAECALALGQSTSCKLALLGSTALRDGAGDEVAANLARFASAGVAHQYYACDVTDRAAVAATFAAVERDLGPVTGIVHGAGMNRPRRIEQSTDAQAAAEVSPKLLGAINLVEEARARPLKLFAAMSSIIGVTGMPGNGWYAFSNDAMDLILRRLAQQVPTVTTVGMAFGVWSGVGMGHRMGSVERLASMGIGAIGPEEGTRRFLHLFLRDPGVHQVVVTAPLGQLDTWRRGEQTPDPALRFVDRVLRFEPGVELVARTRLTLDQDPYVADHIFRGTYLFPAVFGLEAMSEAVLTVNRGAGRAGAPGTADISPEVSDIVEIGDILLLKPIAVDREQGTEIEVRVLEEEGASGKRRARASIRCQTDGFRDDFFSATFTLGRHVGGPAAEHSADSTIDIVPTRDLYGGLLFQGERFQRLRTVHGMSDEHTTVGIDGQLDDKRLVAASFGGPAAEGRLVLGDPFVRDVMLQSVQLIVPRSTCLPIGIGRIERFARAETARWISHAVLRSTGDTEYLTDVFLSDEAGRVVEILRDYRLHILERNPARPTPAEMAERSAFDQRSINDALGRARKSLGVALPTVALRWAPDLAGLPAAARRDGEREMVLETVRTSGMLGDGDGAGLDVEWEASGKPALRGLDGHDVSLSQDSSYVLVAVGEGPQGCDIEPIVERDRDQWLGLVGANGAELLALLAQGGQPLDRAGTLLWSAREAAIKALLDADVRLTVLRQEDDAVLLDATAGDRRVLIAATGVFVARGPQRGVAVVVGLENQQLRPATMAQAEQPAPSAASSLFHGDFVRDSRLGGAVYSLRFPVSFKETNTLHRGVYFPNYLTWMGRARELAMREEFAALVPELESGKVGAVTNWASVEIVDDLGASDVVDIRTFLGGRTTSSVTACFDFAKVSPDGDLKTVARGQMAASWVRVRDDLSVEPMPLPAYVRRFLQRVSAMSAKTSRSRDDRGKTLGRVLYATPEGTGRGLSLHKHRFSTTLEDANLVGNIYFSNFFIWQGRILDKFIHSVAPELTRPGGGAGELACVSTKIDFLREAMPFDEINVELGVRKVYECGADLEFTYYRAESNGSEVKLASGLQSAIWLNRRATGRDPSPLPESLRDALLSTPVSTSLLRAG